MTKITESTSNRMTLQSGSTKLTLDKDSGKAIMQRKMLFWALKPREVPLSEVSDIEIDSGVDRASGVEVCNTMLVTRGGTAWSLAADDKKDAEETAGAMRGFLGLPH
jgi:hypothetical protein